VDGCPDAEPGEHVPTCPLMLLQQAIANTAAGDLMIRVSALRRAQQLGVRFTLDDLALEELNTLDLMDREESAWQREMQERERSKR